MLHLSSIRLDIGERHINYCSSDEDEDYYEEADDVVSNTSFDMLLSGAASAYNGDRRASHKTVGSYSKGSPPRPGFEMMTADGRRRESISSIEACNELSNVRKRVITEIPATV